MEFFTISSKIKRKTKNNHGCLKLSNNISFITYSKHGIEIPTLMPLKNRIKSNPNNQKP